MTSRTRDNGRQHATTGVISRGRSNLVPGPADAVPLTTLEALEIGQVPGIYAAWIKTPHALADIGVARKRPLLVYVGKAVTRGGLRHRLREHIEIGMAGLDELLGARGRVLFPWWSRMWRPPRHEGEPHRPLPSSLSLLTQRQVVEWQLENLHWSWEPCTRDRARGKETRALEGTRPLLNRSQAEPTPPQLRHGRGYEASRARWLWQVSWAALLTGRPRYQTDRREWGHAINRREFPIDDLGFPLPESLRQRAARTVTIAEPDDVEPLVLNAAAGAPAIVRHAMGGGLPGSAGYEELRIWWAAHAAARYLPDRMTVEAALSASLRLCDESSAAGPKILPAGAHRQKLAHLAIALGLRPLRH